MTDFYAQVEIGLQARLATLTGYFPAKGGKPAGWQVTTDENVVMKGADHFALLRPGAFPTAMIGRLAEMDWHVTVTIYLRFVEYAKSWADFRTYRSDIFNLLMADPTLGGTSNVYNVLVGSNQDAGRLEDSEGNAVNFIAQALDIICSQRITIRRSL